MEPEVADGSDEKGAQQAADGEDYYDLKKTLPRFYRLFEHLNKGQRPTPSIMANALDVVERMCKKDALEKVIDGFMRLDGTFSVEVESGRVVLRRRLLHLRIQFNGMRLFRSYAPVVEGDKASRLAYAATAPELIERFPQRVDGVELARKYLLALLPLSEKEVQSSNVMTINCPEKPREILEQIVGIPGLRSIVDNFDITVDIQSTAPANLLSALGLPEGHGFRGRGVIWSWRHAAMSTFAAKAQPLEQLFCRACPMRACGFSDPVDERTQCCCYYGRNSNRRSCPVCLWVHGMRQCSGKLCRLVNVGPMPCQCCFSWCLQPMEMRRNSGPERCRRS